MLYYKKILFLYFLKVVKKNCSIICPKKSKFNVTFEFPKGTVQ